MSGIVMVCVYVVWLFVGVLDFYFYWCIDLLYMFVMCESLLYGLQLLFIGSGVLVWFLLESIWLFIMLLVVLVIVYVIVGYFDIVSVDGW